MPRTLLLADDSITIQRVIELTFAEEKDIQVVAVSDGDQAIARLDAEPPDIVLVDVGMPGRSGYEVADYIRRSPRLSHIPVILLTGASEPIDRDRAAAAGCDDVLVKPFEPDVVIGRVKELLQRRPDTGSWAPVPPSPSSSQWSLSSSPQTEAAAPIVSSETAAAASATYFDELDAAFARLNEHGPSAPSSETPLAEAFASLLDAEEQGKAPSDVNWPEAFASRQPIVSEALVEEVVLRVLARLPERVIRQAIADRVSEVAERLVREEIDRIKSFMK